MLFREVIGQQKIKLQLVNTVAMNHISHAQLFLGEEGFGTLPLALAYAQYICCTDKKEDDSCGVCPSCLKYGKLIHPDLHFVFPVANVDSKKKTPVSEDFIQSWREQVLKDPYFTLAQWVNSLGGENKQGLIHKEESREIIKKLNLKTFEAEYKVMIIWKPETMNASAANTLLKILEEPPEKTLFLLIATTTEGILPTILSRTQLLRIKPIDDASLSTYLQGTVGLQEDIVSSVSGVALGNKIKAIEYINSSDEQKFNLENFIFLMRRCYQKYIHEIISWIDEMQSAGREKNKQFLEYCERMIRENLMLHMKNRKLVYLSKEELEFSQKFSAFIHPNNVFLMTEEFNKAAFHIEMNANIKIVLLDLAIKIIQLLKIEP